MTITRETRTTASGGGVFTVPSATTPGDVYYVAYEGYGVGYCQCKDYERHGSTSYACKHLRAVHEFVRQEEPPARETRSGELERIQAIFDR